MKTSGQHPAIAIPNLLYRYANFIDAGDFAGAAGMFKHAVVKAGGKDITIADDLVAMWQSFVRLYDNKPLTRHIITNPIIDLDEEGQTATCRSQWTVIQATPDFPLQVIGSGRYADTFAVIEGEWQFTERRYDGIELMGDMTAHLLKIG